MFASFISKLFFLFLPKNNNGVNNLQGFCFCTGLKEKIYFIYFCVLSNMVHSIGADKCEGFFCSLYLRLPTVAFLSFFHVPIATLLPSIEHFNLRHVVQTHTHTFLQTGCKILFATRAKHFWKWISARKRERKKEKEYFVEWEHLNNMIQTPKHVWSGSFKALLHQFYVLLLLHKL